ncbi:glutamate dehydrogenase (NAD) [Streptoalloteichus tenebrarius]|uniref:Glutamate dehydrogenase (NAD) n=1 Tax=Streptoalloteichus tenebrarius (strain ATCC 17920 / DSM 40477 / JCM 4838 / CBS 697.72 / NBRC 16177 / NCIMB 11028 / NRRL B-12390 / A12253. 1 / ISP 5477) TaxID=1933 RepID=A0ABT1HW41_STRSD|nr:NAD-glutamate dehydrogenase [Streptoalloteichus tenebrarius]MCP2259741.1 glutamate dehydrogenase (NAD) [Streptoalloteichus tenebrarius]
MSSTSASSAPSPSDSRTDGPERTASPEQGREQLLRRAADTAPELADLIELYYRHVPAEEVVDDRPADLVGAVRSHHEIAVSRVPGRPVVRVFNPDPTADGWSCPATVIQVVTDDMPYLVDSVAAELARRGVQVQRVVHPIVVVRRDVAGGLREVLPAADPERPPNDALAESWMLIEVDRITDPDRARELEQRLQSVLNDVREVVEDTDKMTGTARALADELERTPPPLPAAETQEGAELLRWLVDGHFTFLGYRHYELVEDPESGDKALRAVLASGLGVLRRDSLAARSFTTGPDGAAQALAPELLVLTQASAPSTVHRPVYPYYVGVKTFDADRNVTGEHRFLGVFTTSALHEDVLDIPVIERRVREVIHRAGFPLESYSGQRMLEVIQNYPRTELFSTDPDSLYDTTTGVLALAERRKLRLFLRRDPYGRFYSCLVYLPRDRYTTTTRLAMQDVLLAELQGSSLEYSARVGESALARVHFTVHTDPGRQFEPDTTRIQDKLAASVRSWDDLMIDAVLAEQHGPDGTQGVVSGESATELGQRYATLFPEAYKEDFTAGEGLADLRRLQALTGEPGDLGMHFYVPGEAEPGERRFKLYLAGQRVTLSAVLPVLQRMGVEVVDERPYEVVREDGVQCWIYDFGLRLEPAALERIAAEDPAELQARFQEAFAAAWRGDAEVDRFNALVLRAGLGWRQAALLRAYAKYLRQARTPYSQDYIEDAVLGHTQVATALVQLFETRFDPALSDETRASQGEALAAEITRMIDEVTSLDADRILRSYLTLVRATLRTNYFVTDSAGQARPFLSFKLDPQAVPDLPEPRPRFEIFVYSPRVEGVHLRFGPVARGGLRWSDRREDFRTEILGLVKAQAVKNAVIVPVGAKGGFVVKRPPTATGDPGLDREAFLKEGIACYRMFISGLLDLTDNMVGNHVVPARQVVRHDGDDAYLVVAADKGTATFSDIANEVAASYGFWLGDAFASGGSVGYDHKAMGITARGAWESVKRHFRELGVDTQSQDFTVVGVGDMSGDVFGNGMLLSEHIRLVAAFDHRHVFLDPDPNPSVSFRERKRLFELPRSSWDDYDRSKISKGGGVFPRTLKSIPVSPQVREALGLPDGVSRLSPPELIKAILLAPVDLLWNGGIGTYVKASTETHAEVGDKANDAVRVDGADLRVKVVGEGGNLGLTQRGRIEFARAGGKVNTDALDNSAGVDCSDHEVNIKILLDRMVDAERLEPGERNELLAAMTDEVAHLVLADNYRQNAVLGVSRAHAASMLTVHARLISDLEQRRGLDRALEALPTPAQFKAMDQAGQGLTSPELATLLAHVKLALKEEVLASDLPDAEAFARRLPEYFPAPLRERFGDAVAGHPLRREITTTLLVNEVVDGGGISYAFRLAEEMTASATDAVRAFSVVTRVFDLNSLWREIDALDNVVPTDVTDAMVLETRRLLDRASRWLLSNRPQPLAVGAEISRFAPVVGELAPHVTDLLRGRERDAVVEHVQRLTDQGVPEPLARRVATLLYTYGLLDVTEVAELAEREKLGVERSPQETAELYYALSAHLDIDQMLSSVSALQRGNRWHALARLALRDDLYGSLRAITLDALRSSDPGDDAEEKIARWEEANASRLARARAALRAIRDSGRLDLPTLSVAARQVRSMVR